MKIIDSLLRITGGPSVRYLESRYRSRVVEAENKAAYMEETMNAVQLEIENLQYQRLTNITPEYQFTHRHVQNIVKMAILMAVKNPITVRSVSIQADYVFGQGVSFIAKDPNIQAVIDEFINYRENRNVLTSHTSMIRMERRQQVYGSLFFVMNTNPETGRVIIRWLSSLDVHDVLTHPQDREKELWIKRYAIDNDPSTLVYHPAYGVEPGMGYPLPWDIKIAGVNPHPVAEILWDAPVLHVACNRIGHEKFALPEIYPQLDWATAYKRTLEQWVTIIAAFARMAMKVTGLSGKKQAAAAKSLMQTSMSLGNPLEQNPSPVGGSIPLLGKNVDVDPIKTAGATTPASDADPILNMAGMAAGLPSTFFDVSKGNFATAETLDRPTELKMTSRQRLWKEIFTDIISYVIRQAVAAPNGLLNSAASFTAVEDPFTGIIVNEVQWNDDIDPTFEVFFPEILERNVADRVRALVNAVTLFGKPLTDLIPDKKLVALWLMQAMNIPNCEKLIPGFMEMWTKNMNAEPGEPVEPDIIPPPAEKGGSGAEDPSQGGDVGNNG